MSVLYHYFTSGYTGRHGTVVKGSAVRHIYVYGNSVVLFEQCDFRAVIGGGNIVGVDFLRKILHGTLLIEYVY